MTPLPDRIVIVGLIATVGLCFALVFWTVRLNPGGEPPMQWRDSAPSAPIGRPPSGAAERGLL
ncbi:hypothetical protein [Synechococcus sp. CS-1328]|uniref:hypothetical protein n=1 Tax=Synechococcus sp. CS-1328 TaxID=2847976 RepID=UPI00223BFBAF|nr:hypothetical protein [Synechococcus sp. CS-1328]MCT0226052.1 hypothetical protein [Synechococcus sp. CS-1328]